jgi:hypothetical protein
MRASSPTAEARKRRYAQTALLAAVVLGAGTAHASALTASAHPLRSGECRDVRVDAAEPWNRSGILLERGAVYDFRVESVDEPWVDNGIPATPGRGWITWHRFAYWPLRVFARVPSRNWYTLIGAIGRDREHFFYIGDGTTHAATATGELLSFANDKADKYRNNHGRLTLRVCRE